MPRVNALLGAGHFLSHFYQLCLPPLFIAWQRPFEVQGTLDAFRSMLRYGIQGFQLRQLRTVRVPALVLWGAQDTVDSIPAGRKSAQALRARFHLLPGAGHLSMLAAPNAIAREVDAFARR